METALVEHFSGLTDPRIERTKRYPLIEIIVLVIAATVSGCEGWKQIKDFGDTKLDWLRQFLPYQEGIPVDDTIARVMRRLDTKEFQTHFVNWMQSVSEATDNDVVAIDGKTSRGSHNRRKDKSAIHLVSAWSTANGVVLGQEKTAEKSNEITAIPELLEVLSLKGSTVTIDAMGCQTAIAEKIIEKDADYLLAVKGNQRELYEEIKTCFDAGLTRDFSGMVHTHHEDCDAGHGRIEHRACWVIEPSDNWLPSGKRWPKLSSIIMVKSRRESADKITEDCRYYISSAVKHAEKMFLKIRSHWAIENSLHWVLDMTFREDESRIREDAAPENFAIMRHIALNLIKSDTSLKASVKRKRLRAALDDKYRETLIRQVI